ncbi:MAG: hypothetical protein LIO80_10795 [Lachnospiraceae bacterium]|nr:hypothetical protein [Lachnospiraceae bacterium]
MLNKWKKLRNMMDHVSEVLEVLLSVIIIVVVVIAMFFLKTPFLEYISNPNADGALLTFITYILNIVICVELFKVLCSPGTETVLDVMMFVIVRHMIVHDTTAVENLLTIIGVAIIIMLKKYALQSQWCPWKKRTNQPDSILSGKDES